MPYILDTVAPYEYNDHQPSYTPLLQSVFGKVFIHSNPTDALEQVKQHDSPTILLLDLDATTLVNDDNDDDTVYTLHALLHALQLLLLQLLSMIPV